MKYKAPKKLADEMLHLLAQAFEQGRMAGIAHCDALIQSVPKTKRKRKRKVK